MPSIQNSPFGPTDLPPMLVQVFLHESSKQLPREK